MVFNRFFFQVLARVLLVALNIGIFASIFLREDLFFTQVIMFSLAIGQIAELANFTNKTNLELSRFLAGVKDGDYQLNYERHSKSKSLSKLYRSFGQVIDTLKDLETQRNAQNEFLNTIINQIGFGIIVFDSESEITLMNQEASALLSLPKVKKWRSLKNPNTAFLETLTSLPGTQNQLVESHINEESQYFTVSVSIIQILEKPLRVVSFQNIKSEIRQKEIEAWHKLIRILTHETMNSVTPIVSLAETMQLILTSEESGQVKRSKEVTDENLEDLTASVETIVNRGEGILKFVSEYRKLTRIPQPELQHVALEGLVQKTMKLFEKDIENENIQLQMNFQDATLNIDPVLIQQVLINLIKNAIEALGDQADRHIAITGQSKGDNYLLMISDSGPGIPTDKQDKVFIPFYTTKKNGSGIGLSVSRQILNLHGGHLDFNSMPNTMTTFTLTFRK